MATTSVAQVPRVVVTAARLFARHWPMLLTLSMVGVGVRNAAIWAAVVVSDWNSFVGQLLLVFAPLGYLLPIIAMLRLMGGALPALAEVQAAAGPEAPTEGRERRLVDVAVSMLVPFLAVYVADGLMEADRLRFTNEAAFDEFNDVSATADPDFIDRLGIYSVQTLFVVVVVAWVLRWSLGRFERRSRFLALAFVGALVEVFYTGQFARSLDAVQNQATDWLTDRRAVAFVETRYDVVLERVGRLADPVDTAVGVLGQLLGSLDAVLLVPLAWLTVAAVVLGHKLSPPQPRETAATRRWQRVPSRLRGVGESLASDLRERWSALSGSLRLLVAAGLLPMLVFCLVFLLVVRVPVLLSYAARAAIGPVETDHWLAFSPWELGIGQALSMALLAPLLAAALEWLVAARLTTPEVSDPPAASRSEADRT